jgi:excinuclease ABC subunit C
MTRWIYSEMKMCLAPCFKGCSDEEYAGEVARVQQFFDSRGQSLVRELGAERDQASARLEFEAAAALHARVDKLQPVLSQLPEVTRRLDRLAALIVQPSALPESVALFRVAGGCLSDPIAFNLKLQEGGKPLSMEARAQETLAAAPAMPRFSKLETMEHLAMLKRWYFRSSKTGEIFFADEKGDLPWRRIVRGISRVFRGEKPAEDLSETARDYWLNRARETGI